MSKTATPIVLSGDGKRHEPMLDGSVLPVDSLPVSRTKGNLLAVADDGLVLVGDDIISGVSGNPITQGADGGVYLDIAKLIAQGDKVLRKEGDALGTMLDLRYETATAKLTLLGVNNTPIAVAQLPVAAGIFTAAEVLSDYTPPSGGASGTYIHLQFEATDGALKDLYINVSDLVDTYTAGNGIIITDNAVALKLAANGALGFASDGGARVVLSALVSSDASNGLKLGSDGKLYAAVDSGALGAGLKIENGKITLNLADGLKLTEDGKIAVDVDALSNMIAVGVSDDADNILMTGSDGKPYLPGDQGSL